MVDLVVYIALTEEFECFLDCWPNPVSIEEDAAIALTAYRFQLEVSVSKDPFTVIAVCSGAMGLERSATISSYLLNKYRPKNQVILGITGSTDSSILLGDVILPKTISGYLANSAAVAAADASGWKFKTSGSSFVGDSVILNRVRTFKQTYLDKWNHKIQNTRDTIDEAMPGFLENQADASLVNVSPKLHLDEIVLASGPTVGKTQEFVAWLKEQDRKIAALDMETGGYFDSSAIIGRDAPRFLAIRGISDFADERKSDLEKVSKGLIRKYAMENCSTLLLALVEAGLFSESALAYPAVVPAIDNSLAPSFVKFLDSTEVKFQHRHKRDVVLSDLFVFPDLLSTDRREAIVNSDIQSSSFLLDLSLTPKSVVILGSSQAGKTSLAKSLISKYVDIGVVPIYLSGVNIKNVDVGAAIRKSLKRQFSKFTYDDLKAFPGKIVVLLDDFDRITLNERAQAKILERLRAVSSNLIVFANPTLRWADASFVAVEGFKAYRLCPFGHQRRAELIEKWVSLGREDSLSIGDLYAGVDDLTKHVNSIFGSNVLPPRPFFVTVVLQNVETTTVSSYQLTSYGHCYQNLIYQNFSRAGVLPEEFDSLLNYLSELAFFIFTRKKHRIGLTDFAEFECGYRAKYVEDPHGRFEVRLEACGILERVNGDYGFRHSFMLHFFAARYLSENLELADAKSLVEDLCASLYLERNAQVAIFLTHHTKRQEVIDEILVNAMSCLSNVPEASLQSDETSHFHEYERLIPQLVVEERKAEQERRKELKRRDRAENVSDEDFDAVEEGDLDSNVDGKSVLAEFHSSFRSVEIIGQILRNRYGSFRKDQLSFLAEEAVKVGLRALKQHHLIFSSEKEKIIEMIRELMAENEEMSDEELSELAKWVYLQGCYWISFGFIEKIAEALGYRKLVAIFEEIAGKNPDSPAAQLILVSIKLHTEKAVPHDLLRDVKRLVEGDSVALRLLRQIVLRFIYLNEVGFRDKQWISNELGIPFKRQRLLDLKARRAS